MDPRIEQMVAEGTRVVENHPTSDFTHLAIDPSPAGEPSRYRSAWIRPLNTLSLDAPIPGAQTLWKLVVTPEATRHRAAIFVVTQEDELQQAVPDGDVVHLFLVEDEVIEDLSRLVHLATNYV